ncbi:MAG: twin-arginine translocation signal domain-containing protein [Chitinophagaceae bacterium]|nr:MAG: twin-arginine translocation signal domain-containing protein [Chitinophagaceae bacterium]
MKDLSRRKFLKLTGTAAAGFAIIPGFARVAPSDKLRIAHIGINGMGNNHMNWFAAIPEVDIVGLCDVDKNHLDSTMDKLKKLRPDGKAEGYADFRKILERKDIDAITCATPDHWHAQIAMLAFQAGKDVYGEKPLSYDIGEGQKMLRSLKRHDRIFQMGTQIHATDNYHRVVEIIRSGAIGTVHTVRLWKTGFPPDLGEAITTAPPPELDWDMWLGPAPYHDYVKQRCHQTYRYFKDYSGGVFADFWCHIADVAFWAVEPKNLRSVTARGEAQTGIADAPKWIDIDYEFENLKIFWTHEPPDVPGAAKRGIGAYFEGEKGTLICDYNSREITINGETVTDIAELPVTIKRSPGHQQNFVDAVKTRTQPESNLEYARKLTIPMHLGLISLQLNRKLEWNTKREKFRHDKEANSLLHREYRSKWKLI